VTSEAVGPLSLPAFARVKAKRHKGITVDDKIGFFQQFGTLLTAGTPLLRALRLAADQSESDKARKLLGQLANLVASGASLADAMARYPKFFEDYWVELVRAGESTGRLPETVSELKAYIEGRKAIQSKIVSAMMYPVVMVSVLVVALIVMFWKVVPTFAEMLHDFGKKLPPITEFVIGISEGVQAYGLYGIAGIAIATFALRRYLKTPVGRRQRDLAFMVLPLVSQLTVESAMERFAANLSLLLKSGTPLLEALGIVRRIFKTQGVYSPAIASVTLAVEKGSTLASALERTHVFTPMLVNMVRVGEETGKMPQVLEQVAIYYKQKVEVVLARLTGLVEPVIIIIMGISVGVILMSLYLPMFQMSGGPGGG
jgi:type IV pilus assembly protein PilC